MVTFDAQLDIRSHKDVHYLHKRRVPLLCILSLKQFDDSLANAVPVKSRIDEHLSKKGHFFGRRRPGS